MGTTVDLLPRDDDHSVIVVRQRQALDLARAESIDPLADDQWRRVLSQVDRTHHGRGHRQRFRWACARGTAPDLLHQCREMLGRRTAATADDSDPKLLDHLM